MTAVSHSLHAPRPRSFDAQAAAAALRGVERAASFALVTDPQLRELRALLRGSVDRHEAAEAELTELYADFGRLFFDESKMALANYFARRRRLDEAEALLLEVVTENPQNPAAPTLLAAVRKLQRG